MRPPKDTPLPSVETEAEKKYGNIVVECLLTNDICAGFDSPPPCREVSKDSKMHFGSWSIHLCFIRHATLDIHSEH
jgi:hypothetical protein